MICKYIGLPNFTSAALTNETQYVTVQSKDDGSALKSAGMYQAAGTYLTLGEWNSVGIPKYLEDRSDRLDKDFVKDINASLPESKPLTETHPQYLKSDVETNLVLQKDCEVWVTFVHEGAGWLNVLGYYAYQTGKAPATRADVANETIIFPNVSYAGSGGGLKSGNKVQLKYYNEKTREFEKVFPAGTTIAWFVIAQGWSDKSVTEGIYKHYSSDYLNLEKDDNLKRHSVLLEDNEREIFLLGFEDVRRDQRSDDDFNDAVFYATVSPYEAVYKGGYQPVDSPNDKDNDGVTDVFDEYPADPDKAFNNYYPAEHTFGTLVFEDLWPYKGDYDFNDLVIDYNFNQITNAKNEVAKINVQYLVRAIGGSFKHGFGMELFTSPSNINSVIGQKITKDYITNNSNGTESKQTNAVIIAFDDAYSCLPYSGSGHYVNTDPSSDFVNPDTLKIEIELNKAVTLGSFGMPPYNPFLIVNGNRGTEVHLPGSTPTDLVDETLFGQGQDDSDPASGKYYMSNTSLPWAINTPESFSYPIEKESILNGYTQFDAWAKSKGYNYMDWYRNINGYRNSNKLYKKN